MSNSHKCCAFCFVCVSVPVGIVFVFRSICARLTIVELSKQQFEQLFSFAEDKDIKLCITDRPTFILCVLFESGIRKSVLCLCNRCRRKPVFEGVIIMPKYRCQNHVTNQSSLFVYVLAFFLERYNSFVYRFFTFVRCWRVCLKLKLLILKKKFLRH